MNYIVSSSHSSSFTLLLLNRAPSNKMKKSILLTIKSLAVAIIVIRLLGFKIDSNIFVPSASSTTIVTTTDKIISFQGFNDDQIPSNTIIDVNIGTNVDPIVAQEGHYRILVDPLFFICEQIAKSIANTSAFCFAVSNYTGFATFYEYNRNGGSSSLSHVSAGTSHQQFEVSMKRTVLVLEAKVLFGAIHERHSTIYRLKLDMQGYELTTLLNIKSLLEGHFVTHIFAECFIPNKNGIQIYQVDNDCQSIARLLQSVGYETRVAKVVEGKEWSDVIAYKRGMATDFLPLASFQGRVEQ